MKRNFASLDVLSVLTGIGNGTLACESCIKAVTVFHCNVCAPLVQLPMQVTVGATDLCYILPLEVAGFLLKRLGLQSGDWVMVCTSDSLGQLGANLSIRGPVPINLVLGMTHLQSNAVPLHSIVAVMLSRRHV
jgi:hypothetical protein